MRGAESADEWMDVMIMIEAEICLGLSRQIYEVVMRPAMRYIYEMQWKD